MKQYGGYGPDPLKLWLADRVGENNPIVNHSRESAQRLLLGDDMKRVWPVLRKYGIESNTLRIWVDDARRNAAAEAFSMTPSEIAAKFSKVSGLMRQLRAAIRTPCLPPGRSYLIELQHGELQPTPLLFGWHGMPQDTDYICQPLSLEDVLNLGLKLIEQEQALETERIVIRKKKQLKKFEDNTEIRVFVVTLGRLIHRHCGSYSSGTLAHISNAVFNPANPLDKESVSSWFKNQSNPLIRL